MDDEGSECVTCQAYICWRCCTYFSCTFKYIHGEDGHWGLWGDWNFCSKSCRARHHWFRAACKVNTMANFYLNSDPYRTYKRNLQNARLCVDLFSRKNTMHPVSGIFFVKTSTQCWTLTLRGPSASLRHSNLVVWVRRVLCQ